MPIGFSQVVMFANFFKSFRRRPLISFSKPATILHAITNNLPCVSRGHRFDALFVIHFAYAFVSAAVPKYNLVLWIIRIGT